tara:strand:- start:785 stop:2827 length:2043 start_codon:yes stop_codon:yes gene_type:complete
MPVRKVGPNSYQWGTSGKVYTGKDAKAKAERQGKAIYASGYREAESYKPPASAVANAKRGLALRKEYGRGGLSPSEAKSQGIDSGVTRARKIASGKVSRHDVRRMSAFNRHRKNYRPEKKMPDGGPTAGTIAWLLWGGTSGVNWAKKKSASMNAESITGDPWDEGSIADEVYELFKSRGKIKTWNYTMDGDRNLVFEITLDPHQTELSDFAAEDYNSFTEEIESLIDKYGTLQSYETSYYDNLMDVSFAFRPHNPYFDDVDFDAEQTMECPPATQDVAINTRNRNATIKNFGYGPLNVEEPGDFWKDIAKQWNTTEEAAKKSTCGNCVAFDRSPRMQDCMPGETSDGEGVLGYCWMHHFKCHSARTCDTWAKGGPITTDKVSEGWQERAFAKPSDKPAAKGQSSGVKAAEVIMKRDWLPEIYFFDQTKNQMDIGVEYEGKRYAGVLAEHDYNEAENWGGDPEGPLAKALARAREKLSQPKKPLRITSLPHRDQKTLKDFESDNWKLLPRDRMGRWRKPVDSASINRLTESLSSDVPSISELLTMYGGDTPTNRFRLYQDLQTLSLAQMDAALPDDSIVEFDEADLSWMTPEEYYEYILEEPLNLSDDIEDDTETVEFQDRLVRYTAMTMTPTEVDSLLEQNFKDVVADLFAPDSEDTEAEIAFLLAVKRYQEFSDRYAAE